ncbi:hypothetical protein V1289_000220 [Bradyrhizobium sp. AZCC 2289]
MLVAFLAMLSTGIFTAHVLEALHTSLSSAHTRAKTRLIRRDGAPR